MHYRKPKRPIAWGTLAVFTAAGALLPAGLLLAAPTDKAKPPAADAKKNLAKAKSLPNAKTLTEEQKIVHTLNRLGFGPRPDDVQKVRAMGLTRYIDLQLNPERIDDSALDKKLASYTQLQLSSEELASEYHDFVFSTRQAQAMRKKNVKQNAAAAGPAAPATANAPGPDAAASVKKARNLLAMDPQERQMMREARQEIAKTALPVAQAHEQFMSAKVLRAVESERQLQEVLVDFWSNHFNIDVRKAPCGILKIVDDREVIRPHILGKFRDLLGASAKSPAMLVYLDNFQSTSDSIEMNRPRLQRARRAQIARAAPAAGQAANGQTPNAQTPPPPPPKKRAGGLNENYAREIMELHTLGVDGGYTQQDVREVARCLTGWSIGSLNGNRRPGNGKYMDAGAFRFYPALHDNGEKTVLGHLIPAGGGEKDGEMVLDILASHPATMRHISYQLCQRLVSDNPPPSLVEKCTATWKRTDGDLREVARTIVTSPEFFSPAAYQSKIKSPFEYAVSSARALGGTMEPSVADNSPQPRQAALLIKPPKGGGYLDMNTTTLLGQIGTMGQPLFQYQAPTGYPEDSQKWVSSGALISRLNFTLSLTGGKLTGVRLPDLEPTLARADSPSQRIDRLAAQILHGPLAPATRATLLKQVGQTSAEPSLASSENASTQRLAALLLGSPEFQRR